MNTQIMSPQPQPASRPAGPAALQMMICLAVCMALQMTSFVIILPLFARRFTQLEAGPEAMAASSMAYAVAATVSAPFLGALADRIGRRPILLGSLAAYALAFTGYLLAPSAAVIVVLRGLAGALTAGMMPAATGMVADLAPAEQRARWIGILSGGASFGWIVGPLLGGLLYDRWGFGTAVLVSIGMAVVTFLTALAVLRETRPPKRATAASATGRHHSELRGSLRALGTALPASAGFIVLLLVSFGVMFAWAFIEPRFMFYAYGDLGWSSSLLGLAMSVYGVAMMAGEFGLSRLSDDLGRKPVIIAGLVLFSAQFLGLALSRDTVVIAASFAIAGLGNALYDPALSAGLLDITPSAHQARMLGIKSTAASIGSILGPALIVLSTSLLQARHVFLISAAIVLGMVLVAALDLGGLKRRGPARRDQPARLQAD